MSWYPWIHSGAHWRKARHHCSTIDSAELCGIHWQLRRLWLDTSRYLSTACGGGRTAAEIEELALRCPILPTDGLMMTMAMMTMIKLIIDNDQIDH